MKKRYDIVVIGGGAGGLFAASGARRLGAGTCMIEKERLGGDCTWTGCIPSKALLKAASAANTVSSLSRYGLSLSGDWMVETSGVLPHVRKVIEEIAANHPPGVFRDRGIDVVFGAPKFISPDSVEVEGDRITARRFIIATGSRPVIPPVDGLDDIDFLTNEKIFNLEQLPESMVVLGGGPIGVELSQALNRLGVKITLVEMMDRILVHEDEDISAVLQDVMKDEGVGFMMGHKAVGFKAGAGNTVVTVEDRSGVKKEISAESVLVAVGRRPNIEGLDLDSAGVKYDKKGIRVNRYLQTANPRIFACGDVAGPYLFSHMAAYQAQLCVRNSLFRRFLWQAADYGSVPWATFTEPEVAHLGMTEREAGERNSGIKVYKTLYSRSDRAVTDREKAGFVKVITDRRGRILGAHAVGVGASELVHGFIVGRSLNLKLKRLGQPVFIYPTLSELVKKTAAEPMPGMLDSRLVKKAMRLVMANG